jgi:hypothetical protein
VIADGVEVSLAAGDPYESGGGRPPPRERLAGAADRDRGWAQGRTAVGWAMLSAGSGYADIDLRWDAKAKRILGCVLENKETLARRQDHGAVRLASATGRFVRRAPRRASRWTPTRATRWTRSRRHDLEPGRGPIVNAGLRRFGPAIEAYRWRRPDDSRERHLVLRDLLRGVWRENPVLGQLDA